MATTDFSPKPKWLLWAGLASLLWNLFGIAAFIMQATMSNEAFSSLPAEQQGLWGDMGIATWIAYAVAVGAGTLGAICILLGRKWAVLLFLLSLAAIAVQLSIGLCAWQRYDVIDDFSRIYFRDCHHPMVFLAQMA
jgi:hypothetical protein